MTEEGSKGGLWRRVRDTGAKAIERYHRLGWKGKLVFGLGSDCIFLAGVVVLIIGPNEIFARFASLADEIRSLSYAWAIFLAVTVVLSFPPMIGFGTAQTLAGFASTLWPGFLVSAGSCLLGSTLTFLYLFIGDRVYKFADPESRGEMDTLSKGLNAPSIVVSAALAVGASYYVYNVSRPLTSPIYVFVTDESSPDNEEPRCSSS
ncbi:golgi apparatus membrane protein tvp38 [Rhodotorula toruloides]|uniref:Golgi apparatus membrane protein tvp38 n=1 Tax=Rhodotorula toruloides TaxID=5286 RepID=A0A511KA86_RHOTO|nr:golgi apparatus membrane protein tvp38 [Rhodotorula toruloides]